MKTRYISNVLFDEVADVIGEYLTPDKVIQRDALALSIPRDVMHSGRVDAWRHGVLHGVTGWLDVIDASTGERTGSVPVWNACEQLSGTTFAIKDRPPHAWIRSAEDLAENLGTTADALPRDVDEYTDYTTSIFWTKKAVVLTTYESERDETAAKFLRFPFTDAEYEDAIIGLQCWADATHWEYIHTHWDD